MNIYRLFSSCLEKGSYFNSTHCWCDCHNHHAIDGIFNATTNSRKMIFLLLFGLFVSHLFIHLKKARIS